LPNAFFIPGLGSVELVIFLIVVIIGIIAIFILSAVIHFILPIVGAVVVWLPTHSLLDVRTVFRCRGGNSTYIEKNRVRFAFG
jgi:hypothetical protein